MYGSYPCIKKVKTSQRVSNFRHFKTTLVNENHANYNPVVISQRAHFLCTTIYIQLTLFREIIGVYKLHVFRRSQYRFILIQNTCSGVYCENTGKHINMDYCQNVGFKKFTNLWKKVYHGVLNASIWEMYVTFLSKFYFLPYINTAINLEIKKYVHFCLLHYSCASSQST